MQPVDRVEQLGDRRGLLIGRGQGLADHVVGAIEDPGPGRGGAEVASRQPVGRVDVGVRVDVVAGGLGGADGQPRIGRAAAGRVVQAVDRDERGRDERRAAGARRAGRVRREVGGGAVERPAIAGGLGPHAIAEGVGGQVAPRQHAAVAGGDHDALGGAGGRVGGRGEGLDHPGRHQRVAVAVPAAAHPGLVDDDVAGAALEARLVGGRAGLGRDGDAGDRGQRGAGVEPPAVAIARQIGRHRHPARREQRPVGADQHAQLAAIDEHAVDGLADAHQRAAGRGQLRDRGQRRDPARGPPGGGQPPQVRDRGVARGGPGERDPIADAHAVERGVRRRRGDDRRRRRGEGGVTVGAGRGGGGQDGRGRQRAQEQARHHGQAPYTGRSPASRAATHGADSGNNS